jgi:hypothetical protein
VVGRNQTDRPVTSGTILYINPSQSYCGACNRAADPTLATHEIVPPGPTMAPFREGCGARFTHLSSHYAGQAIREAAQRMRPDLPWQRRAIEDDDTIPFETPEHPHVD